MVRTHSLFIIVYPLPDNSNASPPRVPSLPYSRLQTSSLKLTATPRNRYASYDDYVYVESIVLICLLVMAIVFERLHTIVHHHIGDFHSGRHPIFSHFHAPDPLYWRLGYINNDAPTAVVNKVPLPYFISLCNFKSFSLYIFIRCPYCLLRRFGSRAVRPRRRRIRLAS